MRKIKVNATVSEPITVDASLGKIIEVDKQADEYNGQYTDTALLEDLTFNTKNKLCTDDISVELGYQVIRGEVTGFEVEEWTNADDEYGWTQRTIYGPKEYTVTNEDIALSNAVGYPDGITIKQGYESYTGDYTVTAPSKGDLVLPTKDKLMEDDVTISANYEIEDALIQNTELDEYVNDRVTVVAINKFYRTKIKVIRLPNVTECGNSAFGGNNVSTIEELYVPKLIRDGNWAFEGNPYLRILDAGIRGLSNRVRANPMLSTLILRYNGVVSPNASWVVEGCPLHHDGVGGYVYVPQSLIEEYQSSQAWQDYAHVLEFRPIEGSEYELEE